MHRMISALHLSRPENYLSIYQSGCNLACRKCHSWYFAKVKEGRWYTPRNILAFFPEHRMADHTIAQLPDNGYSPMGFVPA